MDVMDDRRRMIAAQPHLATASGESFNAMIAEPKIERVRVYLGFQQSGSGAPSVDNVRTVTGWTSAGISVDGTLVTVTPDSFGSILHGYYDTASGMKFSDCTSQSINSSSLSSLTSYSDRGDSVVFWGYVGSISVYNTSNLLASNMFTFCGYGYGYDTAEDWTIWGASGYPNSFWVKVPKSVLPEASLDGVKAWVTDHPIQVAGIRASGPTETTIDTKQITITRGRHTITGGPNIDSVEMDYWTH